MRLLAGTCELAARMRVFDARTADRINNIVMLDSDRHQVMVAEREAGAGIRERIVQAERVVIHSDEAVAIVTWRPDYDRPPEPEEPLTIPRELLQRAVAYMQPEHCDDCAGSEAECLRLCKGRPCEFREWLEQARAILDASPRGALNPLAHEQTR
jgi:hypothetical protein